MGLLNTDTLLQVQEKLDLYFKEASTDSICLDNISIRDSVGRYSAQVIKTDGNMPSFRRSVVDGYAVLASDTFGASDSIPAFLNLVGQVEMGKPSSLELKKGQAVYVPTGGMIPDGADGMVMVEYAEVLGGQTSFETPSTIAIYKPATPNGHIMNIGDDFKQNQVIFKKGHRFSPKDMGMLATCGKSQVKVFKKPKMAILSTGDEIIDISSKPNLGEIRDINAYAIAAFAEDCGVEITCIKIQKDNFEGLLAISKKMFLENDLLIMSGGSSAGTKDMTADIIEKLGSPGVLTHGISIKPGKPTVIGVAEKNNGIFSLAVGLPGHPMSAIIVFKTVIIPFIKKHYFNNTEKGASQPAIISENIHSGDGRETYQLITLTKNDNNWLASPIHAKSGSISQLADADGYVCIPALTEGLNKGDAVEVFLL